MVNIPSDALFQLCFQEHLLPVFIWVEALLGYEGIF